jgi:hypothetical protein
MEGEHLYEQIFKEEDEKYKNDLAHQAANKF